MKDQPSTLTANSAWETLAQVYAGSRQVSADKVIEWPAQRALAGDFRGKRVLDVGCGTGDKARYFAEEGHLPSSESMRAAGLLKIGQSRPSLSGR
jgi:ubiquinone/menaquinone biosynthesis C-methylase UbiE